MNINEYIPNGGWIKENNRRALKRKIVEFVLSIGGCLVLLSAFAFVGYIENL